VKEFLKTTIVGGVLFLLPLGLVLFILGYALRLATSVAQPISKALHLDQLGDLAGTRTHTTSLTRGSNGRLVLLHCKPFRARWIVPMPTSKSSASCCIVSLMAYQGW
jgi:hypothetical protein